ncbi:MAG: hypothetical protein ABSF47_03370 [Minisyncoccia bacterium]
MAETALVSSFLFLSTSKTYLPFRKRLSEAEKAWSFAKRKFCGRERRWALAAGASEPSALEE